MFCITMENKTIFVYSKDTMHDILKMLLLQFYNNVRNVANHYVDV